VRHPGVAFGPPVRVGRPTVSVIADGLVVGAYLVADDLAWLGREHRVTAIVCLQDHADLDARGLDAAALCGASSALGVAWHHVAVRDGDASALAARLPDIVRLITELVDRGERVYLHCSAGFNRAPTAAIAYLHAARGMPLEDAIAFVAMRRSCEPYAEALRSFAARIVP